MNTCRGETEMAAGPVKPSPELILKTAKATKIAGSKLLQATVKTADWTPGGRCGVGRIFMAIYCPIKTI
jgi:hypothetical protein